MKKLQLWIWTAVTVGLAISLSGCPSPTGSGNGEPAATFSVTYQANGATGGSVPVDNGAYQAGQTVTVLGNGGSLTRSGFSFSGWNTRADGNGTTYSQGQTFAMGNTNVTLYAKWTANTASTYSVTYNGNGNSGGSAPVDGSAYQIGQTVTVFGVSSSFSKIGYTFAGWNTKPDGIGTTYAPGQTFVMGSADVTLYAIWNASPSSYTVTYHANGATGGSVPTDGNNYYAGWNVFVQPNTGLLVKTGYTFAGWNTQADGGGTTYVYGDGFTMGSGNVTLYARWTTQASGTTTITTPEGYTITITGSTTLHLNSLGVFSAAYSGTATAYQWYVDDSAIAGATSAALVVTPPASGLTYGTHLLTVFIYDINGLTYSAGMSVSVTN